MIPPTPELEAVLADRFRLDGEIERTGALATFVAEDRRHRRPVLLTVIAPGPAGADAVRQAVERAARLQHPHILSLLDAGEAAGLPWLAYARGEGEPLAGRLRAGPLPVATAIRVLVHVADALAAAHARGIVHGDLRPEAILLAGRHALVGRFGMVSALAGAGTATGAPPDPYLAPEVAAEGAPLSPATNLYAVGVLGFELLTGGPPFVAATREALLTAQLLDDPPRLAERRPEVPAGLDPVLRRLLDPKPGARFDGAPALLAALEPLVLPSGDVTPVRMPAALPRARLALVAGLALLAAAGWWAATRHQPAAGVVGQRPATLSGQVLSSAISPDGRTIAFVAESLGTASVGVQDLGGAPARVLATGRRFSSVSWSGDGSAVRYFALEADTLRLHEVPRLGGPGRSLRTPGWSALSPDGGRLAIVAPNSSSPIRIPLVIRDLQGGDSLVFRGDTGYWQSPPAWSRDGRLLAWSQEHQATGRVRIQVTRTDSLHPAVVYQDSVPIGTPAWDGTRGLLFLRAAGTSADLYRLPLTAAGMPAGPARLLVAGLLAGSPRAYTAFYGPVSVASSGAVVYTRSLSWATLEAAWLDEWRRGLPPRPLTDGKADYLVARFSQDGRRLAVVQRDLQGVSLRVLDLESREWQEAGTMPEWFGLAWSPAGDRIAVSVQDPDSGQGLRIFTLGRPEVASYLYGQVGDSPEWLDDSTLITPGPGNRPLRRVRLAGPTAELLPGLDTVGWMNWPRVAPGGDRLAFMWNRGGRAHPGIYLYRFRERQATVLAEKSLVPIRWSADGRDLFLETNTFFSDSVRLWSWHPDRGTSILLGAFPPEYRLQDVRPDGRAVVLINRQTRADAWLIERGELRR